MVNRRSKHYRGRMTAHPKITGPLGEFETCPDWVPAMDSCQQFAWMTLKTMPVHGFDHSPVWAEKVRNVSRLGSQIKSPFSYFPFLFLQLAGSNVY
jgi:hypothetical protein